MCVMILHVEDAVQCQKKKKKKKSTFPKVLAQYRMHLKQLQIQQRNWQQLQFTSEAFARICRSSRGYRIPRRFFFFFLESKKYSKVRWRSIMGSRVVREHRHNNILLRGMDTMPLDRFNCENHNSMIIRSTISFRVIVCLTHCLTTTIEELFIIKDALHTFSFIANEMNTETD
jgi:hypothetical protein